ncbi:MAG: SUMF1/EgtB/PvdO family nonheme iron enzyme [candidate division NC10 bacterium]|nr:SUMF1/EgtB/PvdO family nonheme iron enzyme [candidate division NC10 bacterium]
MKIKDGTVTMADLTAAGAPQLGLVPNDLINHGCAITGNDCTNVFAVSIESIEGVKPAAYITWFQAAAAARNAGKRLPTNAEWQAAALGTPDDGAFCNTTGGLAMNTGSHSQCVSDVGAFDMVGNLWEWVADWVPLTTKCAGELFSGTGDYNCLAGDPGPLSGGTAALLRGGGFSPSQGSGPGVFAVTAFVSPSTDPSSFGHIGFRAAR